MGWQRRCSLGDYAVYVCFDQTAPELFTDPETENWIQAKLLRMEQIAMAGSVLFAAVGLALWVWMWLGRSTPVEDLLHDSHLWDMHCCCLWWRYTGRSAALPRPGVFTACAVRPRRDCPGATGEIGERACGGPRRTEPCCCW
mgnify:CR=1 FL=1